jgi:ABC-type phosphate/phosphonate transport system permease subunit|tara:strand:- start:1637 stop:1900 length:264 start_codon:yes stop_codon:yes gene_type:complete
MFFILKLIINMELIDTPNPNAKKVLAKNISSSNFHNENTQFSISKQLQNIEGVKSTFFGPDFVTITKGENVSWETINQDIINIFDKL